MINLHLNATGYLVGIETVDARNEVFASWKS